MSEFTLYSLASVWIFSIGFAGFLLNANLLRRLIAANIMGSAIFLLLVSIAFRNRDPEADPVPHAMVVTGIVVSISITTLAIGLVRRIERAFNLSSLPEDSNTA